LLNYDVMEQIHPLLSFYSNNFSNPKIHEKSAQLELSSAQLRSATARSRPVSN
jgi:hypothetical protein